MNRKRRTEIFVHCSDERVHEWADMCREVADFQLLEEPQHALTMMQMRESAQHSLFYLGEIFVSEARVMSDGVIGIGLIQGDALEKAHDMAVLDAAYNRKLTITLNLDTYIEAEEQEMLKIRQANVAKVLKTRVQFETMDVGE